MRKLCLLCCAILTAGTLSAKAQPSAETHTPGDMYVETATLQSSPQESASADTIMPVDDASGIVIDQVGSEGSPQTPFAIETEQEPLSGDDSTGKSYPHDSLQFVYRNDTLFVIGNVGILPKYVTVASTDMTNTYKRLFKDLGTDEGEHPCDSVYGYTWTHNWVNPYKIPIDSMPDSVMVDMDDFVMPVKGQITSHFGMRKSRYHYGTDIRLRVGDTIYSAFDGQVRICDYDPRGYGNYVVIRHTNGLETVYGHLSQIIVEPNERVAAGEVIALGGNTGRSSGPHLHFEMRYLGNAFNTEKAINYLTFAPKDTTYLITRKHTYSHNAELKALKAAKYITVKKGDNLSVLAKRHGTSVTKICQLNGIKSNAVLRVGQKLRVR